MMRKKLLLLVVLVLALLALGGISVDTGRP